jgi:nicotinate-nucleotide adenylyltransferase
MTQLGAGELEKCDVSDLEIKASGPSYTLKTARRLKSLGINPVYWLIGSDLLPGLPNWHEPHALLSEVRFVVVQRPGAIIRWEQLPQMVQPLRQFVVDVPPIDVSSSQIRALVRAGRPITGLVPDAVEHYIHQHRLYQDPVSDSHP